MDGYKYQNTINNVLAMQSWFLQHVDPSPVTHRVMSAGPVLQVEFWRIIHFKRHTNHGLQTVYSFKIGRGYKHLLADVGPPNDLKP